VRKCVGVLFFVWVFLLCPSLVSADVIGTGQITVQGIVPPMHYVIVNDQNQITEVTSNTTTDVQPTVYRNKMLTINEMNLSSTVSQEYKVLGRRYNLDRIGVVYNRSLTKITTNKSPSLFLSVLTWHNYDYLMSAIINRTFSF
jgi:hypothetical protein